MEKDLAKAALRSGETVIGTLVRMNRISMEILGRTGFDLAIIDAEHSVHTMEDVSNMIRAANLLASAPSSASPAPTW